MATSQIDKKQSYLENDNLRIEYAILQEKIQAFIPTYGKFKVPAIMETKNAVGNSSGDDIYIELYVPYEYTFAWGSEWIPKGTRFLVASIGANLNDMRVVGRYDRNIEIPNPSHKLAQYIIQLIMLKEREQSIFDFCYKNDKRVKCHHAVPPIHSDVGTLVPNNYDRLQYELWDGPEIDEDKNEKDRANNQINQSDQSSTTSFGGQSKEQVQSKYNSLLKQYNVQPGEQLNQSKYNQLLNKYNIR